MSSSLPEEMRGRCEGVLSSFFSAVCSTGEVIGPIVGTQLTRFLGYPWAMSCVGLLILAYAPIASLLPGRVGYELRGFAG